MNVIFFSVQNGIAGLSRSKLTSILSILSMTISLFLLGAYLAISGNFIKVIDELKNKVTLEAFLDIQIEPARRSQIEREIKRIPAISGVHFVSKDDALEKFKEAFSDDYFSIIENNPLPASFQIQIKHNYLAPDKMQTVVNSIRRIQGISDVVYREKMLSSLNMIQSQISKWFVIIGIGLAFLSFVLIWTNIKLTVKAKSRIIETMKLVGAKSAFIRGPFFVQAGIEGAFAGVVASAATYIFSETIQGFSLDLGRVDFRAYLGIIFLGILYGLIGCFGALYRRV